MLLLTVVGEEWSSRRELEKFRESLKKIKGNKSKSIKRYYKKIRLII
jgi:hypothetical protein